MHIEVETRYVDGQGTSLGTAEPFTLVVAALPEPDESARRIPSRATLARRSVLHIGLAAAGRITASITFPSYKSEPLSPLK